MLQLPEIFELAKMSRRESTNKEKKEAALIIDDLEKVFEVKEIEANELENFIGEIESERVERYLRALFKKAKPEAALSDELLAGKNPFSDYLFGEKYTEINLGGGFVDYRVEEEAHPILLEIKPSFTRRTDSSDRVTKIRREELDWRDHIDQVEDYYTDDEYLILTDLRHWYFFSRYDSDPSTPINSDPVTLTELYQEFSQIENLTEYLDRQHTRASSGELDENFFESLKSWISELERIEFKCENNGEKIDVIVNTINKFVFVQTLDSHAVVNYRWVEETWERKENRWIHLGKYRVLEEFLDELTEWFHEYYDTELFRGNFLDYIEKDDSNIKSLYRSIKRILGLESYQSEIGVRGITNYNFREIDEDIFGKAYEIYLVEVRKNRGIYYTPKHVTEQIVSETVGREFECIINNFHKAIDKEDFSTAKKVLHDLVNVRIVDPACGSGSFLIKALRKIWGYYQEIISRLEEITEEHQDWQTLEQNKNDLKKLEAINELKGILNFDTERDLVSKIILRHIHGVDLDRRALEVAKLNLWLEAIKLARRDFRYDNISKGDKYVLPDLEVNLSQGDSLMSLKEEDIIKRLNASHSDELLSLSDHWQTYTNKPRRESPIENITNIISDISSEIDKDFYSYIADEDVKKVKQEKPALYWPLSFWYVYFEESNGNMIPREDAGFDVVIGNPPYYTEPRGYKEDFRLYRQSPAVKNYYEDKMDVFCFFVERAIDISHSGTKVGYIVPDYWNTRSSVKKMNKKLATESKLQRLVDFDEYSVFDDPDIHSAILVFEILEANDDLYDEYSVEVTEINDDQLTISDIVNALAGESVTGVSQLEKTVSFREASERISLGEETIEDLIGIIENKKSVDLSNKPNSQGVVLPQDHLSLDDDEKDRIPKGEFEQGEGIFILTDEEVNDLGLNSKEQSLIKPFYRPRFVEPFYINIKQSENLIYTKHKYIEYNGRDVYQEARNRMKNEGIDYSDADEDTKNKYKQEVRDELIQEIKSKYPNITAHLDRFREYGLISSDRVPYGIHRSRDQAYFENGTRIVSVRKTAYPKFAPVEEPCYMNEGVVILRPDTNQWEITAVLNSDILHFWYREGFGKTMGGLLQMDQEVLKDAPIHVDQSSDWEIDIGKIGKEIHELNKELTAIRQKWGETADKLQSMSQSLNELLKKDKEYRQMGSRDLTWTSSVSFYPDANKDALKKKFSDFEVSADSEKLLILAIDDSEVSSIFEMEFSSEDRLEHTYLALQRAVRSGKRINTLQELLEKTDIPVIGPDIANNTPNILEQAKDSLNISLDIRATTIENKIKHKEVVLNAHIFDMYGIDREQAKTILDSLGVRNSRKNNTLNQITKIKKNKK